MPHHILKNYSVKQYELSCKPNAESLLYAEAQPMMQKRSL